MITVNLIGAMGNQMFQYAYARTLMEEFGDNKIILNPYFTKYYNLVTIKRFKMFPNSLMKLKLNDDVVEMKEVHGLLSSIPPFLEYSIRSKILAKLTPSKYMRLSQKGNFMVTNYGFTFFNHSEKTSNKKMVTGLFQCEKYFLKIKDILLDEFQVRDQPSESNKKMIEELSSCNSVCVHIRRGDYLNPRWSFLNICDEDYYRRGINYIAEHTDNPVFYIFSNTHEEIEWIKNNYKFNYPVKYVDLNNPDYEELRLMYNCNHFIISNSTFSWWGSYLSKNPNKIIVAPDKWQNATYYGSYDIYTEDMIKIPVNTEETK